ncbi:hypothetical protein LCGC14_2085190, partial [marine sediment metagenome]
VLRQMEMADKAREDALSIARTNQWITGTTGTMDSIGNILSGIGSIASSGQSTAPV